jgi:hypothetical protein
VNVEDDWGIPVNLGSNVNSGRNDLEGSISADGLAIIYCSDQGGSNYDLLMSTRKSREDEWGPSIHLGGAVNTTSIEGSPGFSADMRTIYFDSNRDGGFGGYDIYQSRIDPVVDFTDDNRVDMEDLVILIEHWGQNEPAFDMGPAPWGDGIIGKADLEVLMSYWGQEIHNPLVAHWNLDASEGDIAYDSVMDNDASVVGNATWQPDNGQIGGAIQLDGAGSYIEAPPILLTRA